MCEEVSGIFGTACFGVESSGEKRKVQNKLGAISETLKLNKDLDEVVDSQDKE